MDNIDHRKIARQFIMMYDEGAEHEAAEMAGKMLRQGNVAGFNTWKHIAVAISDSKADAKASAGLSVDARASDPGPPEEPAQTV